MFLLNKCLFDQYRYYSNKYLELHTSLLELQKQYSIIFEQDTETTDNDKDNDKDNDNDTENDTTSYSNTDNIASDDSINHVEELND
jgi:hypothetical protein